MILVPSAGDGSRFRAAGYTEPKHYLPLDGVRMVDRVVSNVRPLDPGGAVVVVTQDLVGKTRGAVETIIWGFDWFLEKEDGPLVVANCDQLILLPPEIQMLGDGIIFTFRSANPAHSYVETQGNFILDIVEKPEEPPSDRAVSGVYWFKEPGPFINACRQVDHEGELYVSSALRVMLGEGYNLYARDVPTAILGTPEDFQRFEVALTCAS